MEKSVCLFHSLNSLFRPQLFIYQFAGQQFCLNLAMTIDKAPNSGFTTWFWYTNISILLVLRYWAKNLNSLIVLVLLYVKPQALDDRCAQLLLVYSLSGNIMKWCWSREFSIKVKLACQWYRHSAFILQDNLCETPSVGHRNSGTRHHTDQNSSQCRVLYKVVAFVFMFTFRLLRMECHQWCVLTVQVWSILLLSTKADYCTNAQKIYK